MEHHKYAIQTLNIFSVVNKNQMFRCLNFEESHIRPKQ